MRIHLQFEERTLPDYPSIVHLELDGHRGSATDPNDVGHDDISKAS